MDRTGDVNMVGRRVIDQVFSFADSSVGDREHVRIDQRFESVFKNRPQVVIDRVHL